MEIPDRQPSRIMTSWFNDLEFPERFVYMRDAIRFHESAQEFPESLILRDDVLVRCRFFMIMMCVVVMQ